MYILMYAAIATVGLIIFKDTQNFTLNKNFVEKFQGYGQPAKFLRHVASTWRQDV